MIFREYYSKLVRITKDIDFIKNRFDGKLNYLSEERSIGEISFLITNGYNDEAKRMLLRKVWSNKDKMTYDELKAKYNKYFEKIGVEFPQKEKLGKV